MKKTADISASFVRRMPEIVVLLMLLIVPALPMIAAQTYEIVDLGYDTVYSSATNNISQVKCWGDRVAYYQYTYNRFYNS